MLTEAMKLETKQVVSWSAVAIGLLGVAVSYAAIWVIMTSFAAGVVWYAGLALVASGPTSGIGAAIACRKPQQRIALVLGITGFTLWIALWVLCFTVLGFRFNPSLR